MTELSAEERELCDTAGKMSRCFRRHSLCGLDFLVSP